MRKPVARPVAPEKPRTASPIPSERLPQAFAPEDIPEIEDENFDTDTEVVDLPLTRKRNWLLSVALWALGLTVSLSLGLAAQALITDLFAQYEWLGWLATGIVGVLVVAVIALGLREWLAVRRLRKLGHLRIRADEALKSNAMKDGEAVVSEVAALYANRPDLARARADLTPALDQLFDGADRIQAAERALMNPLDKRARALTAAAARRVTLVTAISPRALVDLAFVAWESMRLARAIATLYGVRPGLFGSWRLFGAILGSLAVTGGIALGDSVIQQLLGQSLAARLSARLGEGLVNGLMTVRVGIAAMRVTRPLPFAALKQPMVMDFLPDLARVEKGKTADDK